MAGSKPNRQQHEVKEFTLDDKARALADLAAGESVHGTARKHGVSPATLRRWREQAHPDTGHPQNPLASEPDFRALTLHFLQESLEAGERILRQTADPAWLAQQRAGELAVFYGVIFDKAARILGALADGQPGAGSDQVDTSPAGLPAPQ